ncbi:kinesin-like protein KIF18B isoform X2 [Melanerpes formicivorus]|uniref:kinesin-like protein KIF18B isoform X2 n=1 Tax=Melanerpes formicivorus TaxID=211600 RepID=UPI00358DF1E5
MAAAPAPQEGTVTVMVRVRPPAPGEGAAQHPLLRVVDHHTLLFDPGASGGVLPAGRGKNPGKHQKFLFDRVFAEQATQEEVFQHTTRQMVDTLLDGYNCSVFAYGATGAGKTYTMLGSENSPGIIYLTMEELFRRLEARQEQKSCEVLVSYLEPSSAEQLLQMLLGGSRNRTQHATDANASSSRSHAVLQVYVKQQDRAEGLAGAVRVAKMSLVDLAGSERAAVAKTSGERLREGASINRSLLALLSVIQALAGAKGKQSHVPYRDSKLTRLLKDSIGGNCRTLMLAALSPSPLCCQDTLNTLKYASRAKEIQVSLKSNLPSPDSHVCPYVVLCAQLRAEVAELQAKLRAYEDAARGAQSQAPEPLPALGSSPLELPRVEEAVPEACLELPGGESAGEQQELAAGCPAALQLALEEAAEERSAPAIQQADVQQEAKEAAPLLQGLTASQPEGAAAAARSSSPEQQSLPQAGSFLAAAVASEALQPLAPQEAAASQEQASSPGRAAEASRASPAQRSQQGSAAEDPAESCVAVPGAPVTSSPLPGWQHLAALSSARLLALSPIGKRRRSPEMPTPAQPASACSLSPRPKRRRPSGQPAEAARAAQSPPSPCPPAAAPPAPVALPAWPCGSSLCPERLSRSRLPLAPLAAPQGCALPPGPDLDGTYQVCRLPASASPGPPGCRGLEPPSQDLLRQQDALSVPKAAAAARSHELNVTYQVCRLPASGSSPEPLGCRGLEPPGWQHKQDALSVPNPRASFRPSEQQRSRSSPRVPPAPGERAEPLGRCGQPWACPVRALVGARCWLLSAAEGQAALGWPRGLVGAGAAGRELGGEAARAGLGLRAKMAAGPRRPTAPMVLCAGGRGRGCRRSRANGGLRSGTGQ